ncbi:MAG: hypothetical protein E7311_04065 [Clostridiales bacterium]|nr:hypothetical protein [Clostridiales bacterium]
MNNINLPENNLKIIEIILNKFNEKYVDHKYFTDGAYSKVLLLNNKYLIKQSNKLALKAEVEFLELNKNEYMQKVLFVDKNYDFVAYEFIHGDIMKDLSDISLNKLTKTLVEIVSKYPNYNSNTFGYFDDPVNSWPDFLISEVNYSSQNITQYIPNNEIVFKVIKELENYPFETKLLHGDFGTHNFVKKDGKFIGIIDPMSVIGDPLYDILFAFASNINIIYNISLEHIYSLINEDNRKILLMLIVVMYSRISRCLKYHKQDIDKYMEIWNKLIEQV